MDIKDRLGKLEKVVKIIKDKLDLSIGLVHIEVLKEDDYFIKVEYDDMFLTKEEYELLKEVLGNE